MIQLQCKKCGISLGEITKGKLKKGTILFCEKCSSADGYKEAGEAFSKLNPESNNKSSDNSMDYLKDMFGFGN